MDTTCGFCYLVIQVLGFQIFIAEQSMFRDVSNLLRSQVGAISRHVLFVFSFNLLQFFVYVMILG